MLEAVQLLYIRNGLNCVIGSLVFFVFKCCIRPTTHKLLGNLKNGRKLE